jgi:hypothetical protein
MPTPKRPVLKTFQCTWCGIHATSYTRPPPGNCLKKPKTKDGHRKPHTWTRVK